jgi:general secretion pathway protein D
MKSNNTRSGYARGSRARLLPLIAFVSIAAVAANAQFAPGQFGGGSSRSRSSSSRQYPNNSTVGDAVISIDPDTRNLVVIADDETAEQIAAVLKSLDKPKPQVLIKVVFLEVQHNNSLDIGLEGGYGKNFGNSTTGAFANAFLPSGVSSPAGANAPQNNVFGQASGLFGSVPPGSGLYQVMSEDYQVTLRAIAQAGKARVLSRPSIIARNNQPATITVGQSVPLITNVRYDTLGNAINSVSYTDVGIILSVTPFITSDGMVEMIVAPETSELVSDRSQWVPISTGSGGAAAAPLINSRSADTVVVTPNGQTVIIGGLMQDAKAQSESKIPLLGDIPVLGNLFKRHSRNNTSTELLIFLTPHIIRAPDDLTDVTQIERERSGATKGLSEKELEKFLEQVPEPDASGNNERTRRGK